MNYFSFKKIIEFKFVPEVLYYNLKQTKTNLPKYFHLSSLTLNLKPCAIPRVKKGQQKVKILNKTIGFCPSRSDYSSIA